MTADRSRLPPLAALLLPLAALTIAACGPAPEAHRPPSQPARQLQACSLLREDDATAALGEPANAMSSVLSDAKGKDPLQCAYNGGISDPPKTLSLLIRPADSPAAARKLYDATRSGLSSLGTGAPEDVPHLGDAAFWVGGQLNQLHVLKAELNLILTLQPGAPTDPQHPTNAKASATTVAGKVLGRL